jgi:hypothetical protein
MGRAMARNMERCSIRRATFYWPRPDENWNGRIVLHQAEECKLPGGFGGREGPRYAHHNDVAKATGHLGVSSGSAIIGLCDKTKLDGRLKSLYEIEMFCW